MHWLDELPGKLPESMKRELRGFTDLQAAWNVCPNGPWLLRIGQAATQDPLAQRDFQELAKELAYDVQAAVDNHTIAGDEKTDPIALGLDYVLVELAAAAEGEGPETTPHRAAARPMTMFDATVAEWHKKMAATIRARFPHPP